MSLQYSSGTLINRTSALTARIDWVNFVSQALLDAGWTTISGTPGVASAGATIVQESAAGNQGQKVRVITLDPGSGTCAQAAIRHSSGSPTSQVFFASPAATWRVIATKFHFFSFITGSATRLSARAFVFGGLLYVPSFLTIATGDCAAFGGGNATTDTDAGNHYSWRTMLRPYDNANSGGRFSGIWVATLMDANGYSTNIGAPYIAGWSGGYNASSSLEASRWEDTTLPIYEPICGWGTGGSLSLESRHKGQLYDAAVINGSFTSETSISFDGHTWLALTDSPTAAVSAPWTLFLAVA